MFDFLKKKKEPQGYVHKPRDFDRDERIEIIGGIWDGNCDAMGLDAVYEAKHREDEPYSPKLFKGKMMRFAHVDNIVLEKLTVKDTENKFADDGKIAPYAKEAVYALRDAGIINGVSDTEFAPKKNATRAEAAVMLYRFMNSYGGGV